MVLAGCLGRRATQAPSAAPFPRQPVICWVDWATCLPLLTTQAEAEAFVARLQRVGVSHLAIETRLPDGAFVPGGVSAASRASDRLLAAAKQAGVAAIAVHATFLPQAGDADAQLSGVASWQEGAWVIAPGRRLSPAISGNATREVAMIGRIAARGDYDMILLVDAGFESVHAGVGPEERRLFESWTGAAFKDWPREVLGPEPTALPFSPDGRGAYWASWHTWRATQMLQFLLKVHAAVDEHSEARRPHLLALVDAPYMVHQRAGLNWAAPDSPVARELRWLGQRYGVTSAGHLLDGVVLGFWQPELADAGDAEREGFPWWASIEGAAALARRYRPAETPVLAAIPLHKKETAQRAIAAARSSLDGVLLIDAGAFLSLFAEELAAQSSSPSLLP